MKKLNNIAFTLNASSVSEKKEELKTYFLNTFTQFEKVFDLLKDEEVFNKQSEITRHPMIFYFGHTATFFINKLLLAKVINQRINKKFESIFAIGVDEMTWDDMDKSHYQWPSVSEVREYINQVKHLILNLIDNMTIELPINKNSDAWIIVMGIEHEKIHIETSLVLHRQMPLEFINQSDEFKVYDKSSSGIINSLVDIPSYEIQLGKPDNHERYGWDNEYGEESFSVDEFNCSKYLVSNEEFMPFVQEDGYLNEEYWCEEGKKFLETLENKYPHFWIKEDKGFKYRAINKIINLPLSWPVDVNALEAKAFLKYKSKKDNINYGLPSEEQYKALYKFSKVDENTKANNNLNLYSSCCVNIHESNGLYDVVGNAWQWCESPIYPFKGFEVHEAYDDFSVPTFDNKHALINGSSWASTGNLIDSYSRYAFREHFFQNASFRYIIQNKKIEKGNNKMQENIYETDSLVSQYCEFQYGQTYFGVENFSIACAAIAKTYIKNNAKALDIGCATGRLSFELGNYFDKVDGIDFSARFVQVGTALKDNASLQYKSYNEGELYEEHLISLKDLGYENIKDKVNFFQGDACNLKEHFNGYDMIIGTNLIDRLYEPKLFLNDIANRLNDDGILILTSPYTWLEEYTKKENWLGGYKDENGNDVSTLESLEKVLANEFELIDTKDVSFVIKETKRKYQHTVSQLSVWRKK